MGNGGSFGPFDHALFLFLYIYIYVCVCVCVCVRLIPELTSENK
jgi:hypothetical protein